MDENIQELKESMLRLTDVLGNQAQLLENQTRIMMAGMKQEDIDKLKLEQVFGKNAAAVDGNTTAVDRNSRAYKANMDAAEEYNKAMKNYADALESATSGLKQVFTKLISQDPSRSFEKYSGGITALGDATAKVANNFGTLGKVLGSTIQGFTKVLSVQMEQADALLKANDSIAKFGTAGSFTTKELLDMANKAGVTSKNMDVLVKPIQSLGPALTNLGKNTGEGVKAFADLAKITNKQREEYQRMGVSQEELMQNQADYIQLQRVSGRSISLEAKDRDALRKASLEYTDNLNQLAALSGQDAATLKKKQQEANSAAELQIKNMMLSEKAAKLRASGDEKGAAKIEKELAMREKLLAIAVATGDKQTEQAVTARLATGTWTEQSKSLALMGIRMEEFEKQMKEGKDVSGEFANALAEGGRRQVARFGEAAVFSDELRKTTGLNKEYMTWLNASKGKDFVLEQKKIAQQQEAAKQAGKDPAQDFRASMTTTEIEVGKAFDSIVDASNILTGGFTLQTIALTAFGAAVVGATVALTKSLGSNLLKSGANAVADAMKGSVGGAGRVLSTVATGAAPVAATAAAPVATAAATAAAPVAATAAGGATTAATAATTAGTALSKLAGPLAGLSKAAPLIGTVMSVGTGVVDAYQGIKKADKDLKEGKITKEEARVEKGEAIGGGAGTAAVGAAGALGGAKAGALIGAAAGPVGIAIGGILGAAVGGWLGSKGGKAIGEVAGGSIAKMTSDADKKVDEATKKAEVKKETKKENVLEKDSAKSKNDPVKVSIVKVEDPNLMKSLGGMMPGTKLGAPTPGKPTMGTLEDALNAMTGPQRPASVTPSTQKLSELEQQREKFEKQGPATNSAQSKLAHERILQQMDRAIANEKAKASAPKAAVGGIFEGPKSGYPVELHGKEAIVPLGTGSKTSALAAPTAGLEEERDEELEKEIEALAELKKTMRDTDASFDKLSSSIIKLNKLEEEKLENTEDQVDGLKGANDKLKEVFRNVGVDLTKFTSNIKFATQEASSTPSVKMPDIGGILGGSAGGGKEAPAGGASGGTGVKPPSAPPLAGMGGGTGIKPAKDQDIKQNLGDVKAALMKRGMTDEKYLNAVLGNVMKESGGKIVNEKLDYSRTSNERIRSIFGSRAAGKTDAELNQIKSSEEGMGEFMYGKDTKIGRSMGNMEPGDGFKYRGRGYIQLTGKNNYAQASQAVFGDDRLVKDPDLLNDPKVAAEVVAWYMERGKSRMATSMGIDEKNMTQDQANLLATSQIAGGDVRRKGAYLAGEVMNKVTAYAGSKDIQGIQPSSGGTMVASADSKKSDIPKAQRGGVFEGPDSGYLVELHGNETVIPNDKIASIAKTSIESSDMLKKIMPSGIATADSIMPATAPSEEMTSSLSQALKEMTNNTNNTIVDTLRAMQDEFKLAITQLTQQNSPIETGTTAESVTELLNSKLDVMIDKLSQSNDTQDKLLQYSKV